MLPAAAGWQPVLPRAVRMLSDFDVQPWALNVSSNPALGARKALVRAAVLRQFRPVMAANRRLGCLSIFLFVALCASLFVNFVLMVAVFQRFGGVREAEPIPRFREILLQRGARATTDKIAVITMRGLISSSIPGNVSDSMVDDMRAALQQARDDSRVKAIVLEVDSPGGEVTASDAIYSALVKRAQRNRSWFTWNRWQRPAAITFPAAANS